MVAMNSMPQHEVANGRGQIELLRARPITLSKVVANTPGAEYPSGGSTLLYIGFVVSIISLPLYLLFFPVKGSLLVDIIKPEQ
jgi:hypothetical protein